MKVKVQAKISRIMNYELLYSALLKQMETQKEEMVSSNHMSHDKKPVLEEKDAEIEALSSQIKALQLQLDATNRLQHLQEEVEGSKVVLPDETPEHGSSAQYKDQIKQLSEQHLLDLELQRGKYESRIANYLRTINDLKNEINTLQDDVQSERQRHLATVQSMRGYHAKIEQLESSNNERTQELLDELQEKMLIIEDMKDALGVSSELIKTVTENAENEHKKANEMSALMQSMYSKEQVKEIEVKFMEFISKLTNRVNQLEDSNKSLPVPIPHRPVDALIGSSRDVKLEPGGRVVKVTSKKL
jgi:chromosome segregation ATPase